MIAVASKNTSKSHQWRFFRSGGFDQVRIETADDLRHLDDHVQLDERCHHEQHQQRQTHLARLPGRGRFISGAAGPKL